jgi:hypothetical protein
METDSLILCDLPGEPLRPPGFFLAGFRAIVLADAADLVRAMRKATQQPACPR